MSSFFILFYVLIHENFKIYLKKRKQLCPRANYVQFKYILFYVEIKIEFYSQNEVEFERKRIFQLKKMKIFQIFLQRTIIF